MPNYSIFMRLDSPDRGLFQAAIASLAAQIFTDLEILLVVDPASPADFALAQAALPGGRVLVHPKERSLASLANQMIGELGNWIGFMGQHDQLGNQALAQITAALLDKPQTRIVYTDEVLQYPRGEVPRTLRKHGFDDVRLLSQEYLRGFTVISAGHLQVLNGFNELASDSPAHDVYLRTLEMYGPQAFLHLPVPAYVRHVDYRPAAGRSQDRKHMAAYDLYAIKEHLSRQGVPATVRQVNGTVDIDYRYPTRPSICAVITVTDDTAIGLEKLRLFAHGPQYRPMTVEVLHIGGNPFSELDYRQRCKALKMGYTRSSASTPVALNLIARQVSADLILFMDGIPLSLRWLERLADHSRILGTGAIGPRLMTPTRLTQPGTTGYQYEGHHWDSRGELNELSVPHRSSVVSPACMLIDLRLFLRMNGFDTQYPTLYGMDLCMRLAEENRSSIMVPQSQVQIDPVFPVPEEVEQLWLNWSGWTDYHGVHKST